MHLPFSTLYIPDFAAWTLQYLEPELRDREVLVQMGGKVVARSEGLRQQGIELGWAIERATAQAPDALVKTHPGHRVRVAWEAVLAEINAHTPWLETGVALCPYTPLLALPSMGTATAQFFEVSDAILLATKLRVRIGVAADRATSLLAALSATPGQACVVEARDSTAFRARCPLLRLAEAGFAPDILLRLGWLGSRHVGDLMRFTRPQLAGQFDDGELLYGLAQGEGEHGVAPFMPAPSITMDYQTLDPLIEPAQIEPVLSHLVQNAWSHLGDREAQMVTVQLQSPQGQTRSARRISHDPTAQLRSLWQLARLALGELQRGMAVETLTVALGGLRRSRPQQELLWAERDAMRAAIEAAERRCPGSALRLVERDPTAYLPEEAFQLVSAAEQPPVPAGRSPKRIPAAAMANRPQRRRVRQSAPRVRHDGSTVNGALLHETLAGTD